MRRLPAVLTGWLARLGAGVAAWSLAATEAAPWFQHALVGMEVGPTGAQFGYSDPGDTRYCARFDGREVARRVRAAHGEYLVMWARDGDYAYYDSKLLPKAPGLGARDPLREAVAEARARLAGPREAGGLFPELPGRAQGDGL